MGLRPIDLPDLRAETVEFVSEVGQAVYERAIRDGRQNVAPLGPPARAARQLADAEVRRLREAELFFVSADMADLAVVAAKGLPTFVLAPEDLPAKSGLIYFDHPIATVDYGDYLPNEGRTPIVAAAWSYWTGNNPYWTKGGIWITWYGDRDGMIAAAIERGIVNQDQAEAVRSRLGRLMIDNECQTPFTDAPVPVSVGGKVVEFCASNDDVSAWMAVLKTAWLLMGQSVAAVSDAVFDRAAKRRAERLHQPPPSVRVITLRRPPSPVHGQSEREYHHQWIVRGHWRQQWYASREVHRPVWIAPHVKGPEGAPLIGGEKVYAWTR